MFVLVYIITFRMSDFLKAIHIQLTYERGEIPMLEVTWQDILSKAAKIIDDE